MRKAAVIFIHGLFSSASTWKKLTDDLSKSNEIIEQFDIETFEYATPRFAWNPLARIPDLNVVADNLRGFIIDVGELHERIILVTHSQGGLVAQRYLSRMLADGRAAELAKIRRLVMFACPNNGSELFLLSRRGLSLLTRNSQERELRPLQSSVVESQRRVMRGVVQATELSHNGCPIPVVSYAGETDNVVAPASALSVFPDSAVLPGDHFSVIKPNSNGRLLSAMRRELSSGLMEPFPEKYLEDLPSHRRLPKDQDGGFLTEQELLGPISIHTTPNAAIRFFVHGGPVEQLANVDVVLSSENTYLQMSQFFKSSTSGSLRFAAAIKGDGGEIQEDVAGDHLVSWLRNHATYGLQVAEGTVVPTPAGALAAKNVHRIYHAAIVSPISGTNNYTVNPLAVTRAIHNIFDLARRERKELKVQLTSICIPLFGAGRGGINITKSFDLIWDPLMKELTNDPSWEIHFTTRRRQNFDQVYKLLQGKKSAEQL
ncbi:alpha/beta fold hydrolase [Streptomyces sp. NPDC050597]|uniref:alpha/beta fold hydrolase n=1 Tax=Streptomyces sp. NPDC050597 TaxID=3157212 RepID=UPI00342210C1